MLAVKQELYVQGLVTWVKDRKPFQPSPVADSEPVAWTWHYREQWHVTNDKCRAEFVAKDGDVAVLPLYRHAQPAPASPVCTCPSGDGSLHWPCPVHPGNSPAQSDCCPAQNSVSPAQSHGWIPVSERMPIEFEAVIAFDGDQVYGEAMYSSDDGFTIDGYEPCDRLNLRNVTHWMPLPAAPQEVK
ncbi:TPA: DUF551 domain-containing protein [Klebsiella pneumoniae]|nr:DUF551 domain-containing protein [Klebsiella pneumoniae]